MNRVRLLSGTVGREVPPLRREIGWVILQAEGQLPGLDLHDLGLAVAGDSEADMVEDRTANGVPVENGQYDEMRQRAAELNVEVFI